MKTNKNDEAFAGVYASGTDYRDGLTKLEYFAATALQGILTNGKYSDTYGLASAAEASVSVAKILINKLNGAQDEHEVSDEEK